MDEVMQNTEKRGRPLTTEFSKLMGFSIHTNLAQNLLWWRNAVMNQDIDFVCLVDGVEGGGKSVHAMQIAAFMDKDRKIDIDTQVCYTNEDLTRAITTLPKFKSVVFDEAGRGFNRRSSTDKANVQLVNLFRECRKNNLFLFIVMPSFYDMDMNMAVWRSRCLIHIDYTWDRDNPRKPLSRGLARFYNEKGKKSLYCNKLWRQQYHYPFLKNMSFDYRFPHHYVVSEEEYRRKKQSSEEAYRQASVPKKPVCGVCGSVDMRFQTSKSLWVCHICKSERAPTITTNMEQNIKESNTSLHG
jgi:ribosomal protein L37AE/L43A